MVIFQLSISFYIISFMGWLHQADMCCDFRLGICILFQLIWLATEAVSCAQFQGSRRHGCEAAMISSKPGNTMKYLQDSIQTYIHTDIRTDIHVYIYIYTCIYIYIRVYVPLSSLLSLCPAESSFV